MLARGPVELEALDILPGARVLARLGGRREILESRAHRLVGALDAPATYHDGEEEICLWRDATELAWRPADDALVQVGLSIRQVLRLEAALDATTGAMTRYAIGGTLAWISWPESEPLERLDRILCELGLSGIVLIGSPDRPFLGPSTGGAFGSRIIKALDPDSRFLEV